MSRRPGALEELDGFAIAAHAGESEWCLSACEAELRIGSSCEEDSDQVAASGNGVVQRRELKAPDRVDLRPVVEQDLDDRDRTGPDREMERRISTSIRPRRVCAARQQAASLVDIPLEGCVMQRRSPEDTRPVGPRVTRGEPVAELDDVLVLLHAQVPGRNEDLLGDLGIDAPIANQGSHDGRQ